MKRDDMLKLDSQLCFVLYAASRRMSSIYAPYLEKLGLTYPQYLVMLVLWERDCVEVGHIAEKLMLDTGTLSPLLKKLEAAGLVGRERSSGDERKVIVVLSAKGRSLKKSALDVPKSVFSDSGFTEADYIDIRRRLGAFLERLK